MTAEKPSTMKVSQSKSATNSGVGSGEPNNDAMVSTIVKQLRAADLEAAISARMKKEKYEQSKEAFDEEKEELRLQLEAGELDIGQDDDDGEQYVDRYRREVAESSKRRVDSFVAKMVDKGTCFAKLCAALGVPVVGYFSKPADLDYSDLVKLSEVSTATIGCVVYSADDKRNHVELVQQHIKTGTLNFVPHELSKESERFVCITRPQEFFNAGGRFFNTSFFASTIGQSDSMQDFPGNDNAASTFGGDTMGGTLGGHSRIPSRNDHDVQSRLFDRPPPPRSVVDESTGGGSNNITGGVSRRRNRVVKGMATYNENGFVRRNYGTSGVTMFNNVEELYLNTVSREYAQEILEELFRTWGLPTDEADAMQYAEDLVWAFLVARTASNKADYNVSFEVPTRKGEVNADFSLLSRLLADKYGITRRNFARGVADDVRAYLSRSENQFVKSRSAQRVGADPQYGSLCFDGSTGCTNMTSSEATFCRLLEGRNLYERDDVIAEGASDKLMQGLHGGVRSIVPR